LEPTTKISNEYKVTSIIQKKLRYYLAYKTTKKIFMLYWLSSYCIKTIIVIVYKMVVLLMACCTCTGLFFLFVFCLLYHSIICGQFNFLLGRPVSEL